MGLINKQMAPPAGADEEEQIEHAAPGAPPEAAEPAPEEAAEQAAEAIEPEEGAAPGSLTITPQSVREKLHLTPEQAKQLQKVVAAGMKIMFDPKTHQMMLEAMAQEKDMPTKLGESIAGLMGIIIQESKGSVPGELIVPAGLVLMAEAAEFVAQTEGGVTDQDIGNAAQIFVHLLMNAAGMDADKMAAMGEQGGEPAPAEPAPPPAGGIVGQTMGAPR